MAQMCESARLELKGQTTLPLSLVMIGILISTALKGVFRITSVSRPYNRAALLRLVLVSAVYSRDDSCVTVDGRLLLLPTYM